MQDPVEGLDGRAGVEEGEDSQQRTQAPDAQASSQTSAAEGDHGNFPQSCPQDSERPAAPGTPAAPGSQAAPGSPSPGSAVGSGAAAEEAVIFPHSEQVPLVPGPSGDTASTTGNRLLEFSVTVPFRTAVEADMARRSLVTSARRQQVMVQQEFTVNDSILAVSVFQKSGGGGLGVGRQWCPKGDTGGLYVSRKALGGRPERITHHFPDGVSFSLNFSRWTTEDPVLFRISINTFLDQLSLVMRNIQRLEFVAVLKRGRGRSRES